MKLEPRGFYRSVFVALAVIAVYGAVSIIAEGRFEFTTCPSRLILGVPCPGCGTTRAFLLAMHGHWGEAVAMNPNFIPLALLAVVAAALLANDMLRGRDSLYRANLRLRGLLGLRWIMAAIIVAELAIWARNIARDGIAWL